MNPTHKSQLSSASCPAGRRSSPPAWRPKTLATFFLTAVFVGGLVVAGSAFPDAARSAGHSFAAHAAGARVPATLDAFYPPAVERPVYLFQMLSLDEAFAGIVVDLSEDDLTGAKDNYELFRARYAEVRALVPEWESYYPMEPVERLGEAFAAGSPDGLMAAFGKVGQTCHHCHQSTMVPVQQRYHWGDFGDLELEDPLRREAIAFSQFKQSLSANLTGIRVDLRQGQPENALRQFDAFKARFAALSESCLHCHERDDLPFTDREVQRTVEQLGQVLRESQPSSEATARLIQAIGEESCSKCHLVHVPAAVARAATR